MTDTSTQAVEAIAKTLDGRSSEFWKYAALFRALAAERDELATQLRSRLELLDSTAIREARTSARRAALEEAEAHANEICDVNDDSARRTARIIAATIRALIEEEQK